MALILTLTHVHLGQKGMIWRQLQAAQGGILLKRRT